MAAFHYLVCDGGPHIVLPVHARRLWEGLGANHDPLDPNTDYARACSVEPPAGLIPVGSEQALVLAGSPPMSGWGGAPQQGNVYLYVFERWSEPELDRLARSATEAMPVNKLTYTGLRWTVAEGGLLLMFAGDVPGKAVYGEVPIPIPSGRYRICMGKYEGREGELLIVALDREAPHVG